MQGWDLVKKLLAAVFQEALLPFLRLIWKHEEAKRVAYLDQRLVEERLWLILSNWLSVYDDGVLRQIFGCEQVSLLVKVNATGCLWHFRAITYWNMHRFSFCIRFFSYTGCTALWTSTQESLFGAQRDIFVRESKEGKSSNLELVLWNSWSTLRSLIGWSKWNSRLLVWCSFPRNSSCSRYRTFSLRFFITGITRFTRFFYRWISYRLKIRLLIILHCFLTLFFLWLWHYFYIIKPGPVNS